MSCVGAAAVGIDGILTPAAVDWRGKTTDAGKVHVSDHDESDPFGETRSAEDPLGPFEAFKAARGKESAAAEPFPESSGGQTGGSMGGPGEAEPTAIIVPEPGAYGAARDGYAAYGYAAPAEYPTSTEYAAPTEHPVSSEYAATYPPPPPPPGYGYAGPVPTGEPEAGGTRGAGRGRLRSVVLFGGAALVVVGIGAGVYAATSSGSPAGSPGAASSAPASPGASKAAKGAKAETVRLTVTIVNGDSFTGTTAGGQSVTARIAAGTKFGTAARPFTRSQLVPGAVVYARLRRETGGTVVATVIAAGTSDKASGAASASPSAGA